VCGIAGIFDASGGPADPALLDRMAGAMVHRGPDDFGRLCRPGAGLAVRRLKVIDLESGAQPISNEDGSVTVIFNGEIYNFAELREGLVRRGHRFSSRSDTEVIVHLYEEQGPDFVAQLRGMFAIALWDARTQQGMLVRDRAGKKPLVYAEAGPRLYFASELQALVQAGTSHAVDPAALADYLFRGYVPAPATIYRAARKLPPAHRLLWRRGQVRIERYWRPEYLPKLSLSEHDAETELERILAEAVRLRLVADVPVGALLSGGIDSGTVVALMARLSPAPVKTFSIGFDDRAYDELAHARRVAERYGTDHHEFVVKPDAAAVLPMLVHHYGEPYADSSAVPTFYVCRLARAHVTVALTGDGGDEAFAGYDRCRAMLWSDVAAALPGGRWLAAALGRTLPATGRRDFRLVKFLRGVALPRGARHRFWLSNLNGSLIASLLSEDCARDVAAAQSRALEDGSRDGAALAGIDGILRMEFLTSLPDDLLVKMDIAGMANSLETRSPLLDQRVVEFAARLPVQFKIRRGVRGKYLLRRVARRLLPPANVNRPKMGFGAPVAGWLRGPLRDLGADALLGSRALARGYFRSERIARLWNDHQSGAADHGAVIWMLLMLEMWHREFTDTVRPADVAGAR
jgi:asparagine synthase (glutamine-hydrolysing)